VACAFFVLGPLVKRFCQKWLIGVNGKLSVRPMAKSSFDVRKGGTLMKRISTIIRISIVSVVALT
jgi:hypothetical protein